MPTNTVQKPSRLVGLDLARAIAQRADEKQAEKITILDLRGISQLADYFVICSSSSLPHLKATRDEIVKGLIEEHGERPNNRDGAAESHWMILDYIDVVVHIFHEDLRSKYALEDLWGDAPLLDWQTGSVIQPTQLEAAEQSAEVESAR